MRAPSPTDGRRAVPAPAAAAPRALFCTGWGLHGRWELEPSAAAAAAPHGFSSLQRADGPSKAGGRPTPPRELHGATRPSAPSNLARRSALPSRPPPPRSAGRCGAAQPLPPPAPEGGGAPLGAARPFPSRCCSSATRRRAARRMRRRRRGGRRRCWCRGAPSRPSPPPPRGRSCGR